MTVQTEHLPLSSFPTASLLTTPSTTHILSAAAAAAMHAHATTFVDARSTNLHAIERISGAIERISGAITIPLPSSTIRTPTIVVYDCGLTCLTHKFSLASTAISFPHRPPPDIHALLPAIRAEAPALVEACLTPAALLRMGSKLASRPSWTRAALDDLASSATPTAQILNWLYLGSAADACKKARLTRFGVTHILCVADELQPAFDFYESTRVEAKDMSTYNLLADFPRLFDVLGEVWRRYAKGEGVCVFVHFAAGLSRSAAVVVALLAGSAWFGVKVALGFVQSKTLGADPVMFMRQMMRWRAEDDARQQAIECSVHSLNRIKFCK